MDGERHARAGIARGEDAGESIDHAPQRPRRHALLVRHEIVSLLACAALGLPTVARGATAPLTLDQVLVIALRDNPDVRQARLRVTEARADQRAAGAIPNPTFSLAPGNPYQYVWSAAADIGPQRVFRARAARLNTEAAGADVTDQVQQTTFDVRQAFLDVLLADSLRTLAVEEEAIVRQLVAADSARVEAGDLSATELSRSAVELAQVEAGRTRAAGALYRARLALQVLMGVAQPDTGFAVAGSLRFEPVDLPLDSLGTLALESRADLAAAERRAAQARALEWEARSEVLPVPSLSLVQQRDQTFDNGSHFALGVSLTVPVFDWNGAARERAAAEFEAARIDAMRKRAQVTSAVASAVEDHLTSRTLASRYASGVLEQARLTLESVRYGYSRGTRSLLDLLDALRSYGQVRSDYLNSVHDYWVSVYALARTVGKELIP